MEIGQLLFVGAVLILAGLPRLLDWKMPDWWATAVAYGIGSVAMFWVYERVAGF